MSVPKLNIVIPAYNEESRLPSTLARIVEYLQTQPYQWAITVVDDGSTDGTAELVRSQPDSRISLLGYPGNKGKGHAVRYGMLRAEGEFLLLSDADLATPIEEVEKLFPAAETGCPVVIGSRPLKDSKLEIRQPKYREYGGRALNKLIQSLGGLGGISDTQCGFKLFSHHAAREIFSRCALNNFSYDFESLMVARDLGLEISEVGVRWRHIEGSKLRPFRDGINAVRDLIKLRMMGKSRRLERKEPIGN
ncbi:MAG: glycosyltransferase family 2 protein [Armatimonadetes bacterium]|nr:glycosyltransferase family 2 protein [Armatimonadota bacterium]